jgi:DNA-binding Lrp family transcriptional regulator
MSDERTVLDEIDKAILYHLQTSAREITNAEISDRVGVSATTIGQRIEDLQNEGVIKDYVTAVDYERAGYPHQMLLFCTVNPDDRHEAGNRIIDEHGVVSVRELISGERNLHVEIVGRTREEVVETIGAIEQNGVSVESSELIKDERRQPFDQFGPEATDEPDT